jgi:hypothetical protein
MIVCAVEMARLFLVSARMLGNELGLYGVIQLPPVRLLWASYIYYTEINAGRQ